MCWRSPQTAIAVSRASRRFLLGLIAALLAGLPAAAADLELSPDSTLEGILRRGTLRVGFEAGYMPFQMIDKRGGLRERTLRPADIRKGGQQASFIGFDIDIAREMAKELGVTFVPVNTFWTSIIPALTVGRFDIIISGMSITPERQRKVDFADPYLTVGQTVPLDIVLGVGALSPAQAAGKMTLYCSAQEDWCQLLVQEFTKATGIEVAMTRKSSGETYAQIRAEARNPKGDVWWGGTGDPHLQAAEEGLTVEYVSPMLDKVHP